MATEKVANTTIKKRLKEFLKSELENNDGKEFSKAFQDDLEKCVSDLVFSESKKIQESLPIGNVLPKSDAGLVSKLPFNIDDSVYYVVWKQVRVQVKNSLKVKFGWQFTVLQGKVTDIFIRHDRAVLYHINDDEVLLEFVFKSKSKAIEKCNILNVGTVIFAVDEGSIPSIEDVVECAGCGCVCTKDSCAEIDSKFYCDSCLAKSKEKKPKEVTDGEEEAGTDSNNTEVDGGEEVSAIAKGKSN